MEVFYVLPVLIVEFCKEVIIINVFIYIDALGEIINLLKRLDYELCLIQYLKLLINKESLSSLFLGFKVSFILEFLSK